VSQRKEIINEIVNDVDFLRQASVSTLIRARVMQRSGRARSELLGSN